MAETMQQRIEKYRRELLRYSERGGGGQEPNPVGDTALGDPFVDPTFRPEEPELAEEPEPVGDAALSVPLEDVPLSSEEPPNPAGDAALGLLLEDSPPEQLFETGWRPSGILRSAERYGVEFHDSEPQNAEIRNAETRFQEALRAAWATLEESDLLLAERQEESALASRTSGLAGEEFAASLLGSGRGELRVQVFASEGVYPVSNARVVVYQTSGGKNMVLYDAFTDASGSVGGMLLPAPERSSLDEARRTPGERPYFEYSVYVEHPGFLRISYPVVTIYDGVESIKPILLVPKTIGMEEPPPIEFYQEQDEIDST